MGIVSISILDPGFRRVLGEQRDQDIHEGGDILDALAAIDKHYMKGPIKVKRGSTEIHSILEFVWDPVNLRIFDDIGVEARDPTRVWLPIKNDPLRVLPSGSTILLTPDPGC